MSKFRDAIAVAGSQPYSMTPCDADAILAMPEMQAIRSFFEWFAHRHSSTDDMRQVLDVEARLPESVIEWVLS